MGAGGRGGEVVDDAVWVRDIIDFTWHFDKCVWGAWGLGVRVHPPPPPAI